MIGRGYESEEQLMSKTSFPGIYAEDPCPEPKAKPF